MSTGDTVTLNFKFVKSAFNKKPWQQDFYNTLDAIDAVLSRYILVQNFQGVWQNATAYTVGQRVCDPVGGGIYTCSVAHTSSAITTFAVDRSANPTFWALFSFSVQFRGAWVTGTQYSNGDFVTFGQKLAVCLASNTAGSSFVTDQTNGFWNVIIDGTALAALPTGTALNADQIIRFDGTAIQYQLAPNTVKLSSLGLLTVPNLTIGAAGVISVPAGTLAAPSIQYNNNTGWFQPTSTSLALSITGTQVFSMAIDGTTTVVSADKFRQGIGIPAAAAGNAGMSIGWDSTGLNVVNQGPLGGYKNMLANGFIEVDQRNNGAATTPAASGAYVVDRWQYQCSQNSKLTFQQSATSQATGFAKSLKISVAAQYNPAAGELFHVRQPIDGDTFGRLGYGAAGALPATLSFWAQASVTGLYSVSLFNNAANRSYVTTFNITQANTPQFFSITIPGDTTGTWVTSGTGRSICVGFGLGGGTTFSTSTLNAWQAGQLTQASTAVQFVNQANASTLFIGPVQLEAGSNFTGFELRPVSVERLLCYYRHFEANWEGLTSAIHGFATATSTSTMEFSYALPVEMAAVPTLSLSAVGDFQGSDGSAVATLTSLIYNGGVNQTRRLIDLIATQAGTTWTRGFGGRVFGLATANSRMKFDCEM